MRKRLLRSVLVAAFSAVVAVGALAGFSGAQNSGHGAGGARVAASAVGVVLPERVDDSVWD
ncbi:hypothetical protein KUM39_10230 [Streptomyces sp. J2-1]|uniref:hypothetical protein n=1 Tax=Streptomyces corallincola TaxID=2851888 RepID=UPI001C380A22|nr:hypothetical protein [Streptomyces corallincola]MBV2354738.1 hypothetical protein [Streptomyces corallincola]